MKNITLLIILFVFSVSAFAQNNVTAPVLSKADLLQKSKNQSTAGWVLLGGGAALSIAGGIIFIDAVAGALDHNDYDKKSTTGGVLVVAGLAAMGGSVPLLLSAHRNKKKAMALVITNEKLQIIHKGGWSYQPYPALSLKINFGRK